MRFNRRFGRAWSRDGSVGVSDGFGFHSNVTNERLLTFRQSDRSLVLGTWPAIEATVTQQLASGENFDTTKTDHDSIRNQDTHTGAKCTWNKGNPIRLGCASHRVTMLKTPPTSNEDADGSSI